MIQLRRVSARLGLATGLYLEGALGKPANIAISAIVRFSRDLL